MEWETEDGSIFRNESVFDKDGAYLYTSMTAIVDGKPYAGRRHMDDPVMSMPDQLSSMSDVPLENIYPLCPKSFKVVPKDKHHLYYLKSPSFEWADAQPGRHFVADRLLSEATLYERLLQDPHPNIARYHGCVVEGGRIRKLCLDRYEDDATSAINTLHFLDVAQMKVWTEQITSAVSHLHKLGYAHNDVNVDNVCIDMCSNAILIDLDSAELFGRPVVKGQLVEGREATVSEKRNDLIAIAELDYDLNYMIRSHAGEEMEDDGRRRGWY